MKIPTAVEPYLQSSQFPDIEFYSKLIPPQLLPQNLIIGTLISQNCSGRQLPCFLLSMFTITNDR